MDLNDALFVADIVNAVILLLLVITAVVAISSHNLLTSTVFLGIFSLLMATEYLVLEAPDVAITEAAVGAGISTILILLALSMVGDQEKYVPLKLKLLPLLVVSLMGITMVFVTFDMPPYGSPDAPSLGHLARYFLEESGNEIGIPNVVTSVLASYRGFDTFGEVVVVFTAAICTMMLIGGARFAEEEKSSAKKTAKKRKAATKSPPKAKAGGKA